MKIGELEFEDLYSQLRGQGLNLSNGPFSARVLSPLKDVARGLQVLYANHHYRDTLEFSDATLQVHRILGGSKARLMVDGHVWSKTHGSLPLACIEWGMNWSIFRRAHHMLVIHAANLERNGCGLFLPAEPGFGKSTLCAALAHSGWRLLSDELSLISEDTAQLQPLARPVCLKDESIDIIRRFTSAAKFGPEMRFYEQSDSRDRIVSHLCPPINAVEGIDSPALPRLVIFPGTPNGPGVVARPL